MFVSSMDFLAKRRQMRHSGRWLVRVTVYFCEHIFRFKTIRNGSKSQDFMNLIGLGSYEFNGFDSLNSFFVVARAQRLK